MRVARSATKFSAAMRCLRVSSDMPLQLACSVCRRHRRGRRILATRHFHEPGSPPLTNRSPRSRRICVIICEVVMCKEVVHGHEVLAILVPLVVDCGALEILDKMIVNVESPMDRMQPGPEVLYIKR